MVNEVLFRGEKMNIKIDIVSGFLGAGKTTLIKKLISNNRDNIAIIENEFGEIAIDGQLLKNTNVNIKEINSGCICCSIEGDFKKSLKEIVKTYSPTKIIIEPSGVAKLSEIIGVINSLKKYINLEINYIFTVVDINNYYTYLENFGEFYKDQIMNSKTIVLSKVESIDNIELQNIIKNIRKINKNASIITSPLNEYEVEDIIKIAKNDIEKKNNFKLKKATNTLISKSIIKQCHKAENVFGSWGLETDRCFNVEMLKSVFNKMELNEGYGFIIRGKGVIKSESGRCFEFHYTPGNFNINPSERTDKSRIAIIGEGINKEMLNEIFK